MKGEKAKIKNFTIALLLSGVACALSACAGSSGTNIITQCILPSDQSATLMGHWQSVPLPLAIHVGANFNSDEQAFIQAAANTWNTFFNASQTVTVLNSGNAGLTLSSNPRPSSICGAQPIVQNGNYSGQAVIYKDGSWPYSASPQTIALTTTCPVSSTISSTNPLPYFSMAAMELNYQNFFVTGKQIPDLQTIVTHEIGHLLGLGHSCEFNTKAGVPNCSTSGLSSDYQLALMFPKFNFDPSGAGEIKRDLLSNDQGRSNCLYSGTSATP